MTRPCVVIINTDDLGWGDLGCQGSDTVETPHLDALAARGVRMTQWYANSPVCSPSRAALVTGRHPAHAGVDLILGARRDVVGLPPQQTVATVLGGAGYDCTTYGKWHLGVDPGSAPQAHGFAEHKGFRAGCVDYYSHIMYWGLEYPIHDLWHDDTEIWLNGRYLTEVITDWACERIATAEQPFATYVAYNAPHYPMHAPEPAMRRFAHLPWDQQVMAAMISCVDDGVGRIVATLESVGVLDDTVIVFTSDNGPSGEERNWLGGEEIAYAGGSTGGLRGCKGSLYEGGIRVPGIWSWPAGLPAGVVCDTPAQQSDVLPTLAAICGVPTTDPIDGTDLLPTLRGEDDPATDRTLTWEYEGQTAVRRGRWKLIADPSDGLGRERRSGIELFDLLTDPTETTDVAVDHPDLVAGLEADRADWGRRLDRWRSAR